jgi:predicted MPP superfamily phosphohydrolase
MAPMDDTLTWLHLSDLHASERSDWDAGRVLETLLDDLHALRDEHELCPDLIFFTGDLAFAGHPDEFDSAGRFLENVREACGVKTENLFLVPGNHDVYRPVIDPEDTAWFDERRRNGDAAAVLEMFRQGSVDDRWRRIELRLAFYRDFLAQIGYHHLLDDIGRMTFAARRDIRGLDVAVAGLNSAWSCHGDDRGRLWLGGDYQLAALGPRLGNADVRIGLVHHPLSWLGDAETGLGRDIERLFDVHLHGHEHDAWVTSLADGHVRVAAGACYDRSDRENGYNVVRLDFENDKGEVSLRRYERTVNAWQGREIAGKTDAQGVWHIDVGRVFERRRKVTGDTPVLSSEILVTEVYEALRHNPLVILLAQDERLDAAVLRGIRERARRDGDVLHVTPPPHRRTTPEQYFARLGRQCDFTEEIRSPDDWEDVLYRRLQDGETLFVLVSSFDKGSEEGREQLGTILRALAEAYPGQLRVVFSGGERLAALKYEKGEDHSVLSSAERHDWPETTVDDVLAWQQHEYPKLAFGRGDAKDLRALCGAHPRWIRHCLGQRQRGANEREALVRYDAIDQVFIPYRNDPEARRRICRWLGQDDLGAWEAWIGDELLRRLYWKNVLREEDGRIVWRSEVACDVGRRVLGCG